MQPILLLETRTLPMTFLTSRSLQVMSITSQGSPLAFQYCYQDIPDMLCYGQSYELLDTPEKDLRILTKLGETEYEYLFRLRS